MAEPILQATPDHIVSTSFEGGEGVLIDLNAKRYYKLNETAMLVWTALEEGCGRTALIERMTNRYDVTREKAAASVERLLRELRTLQILAPPSE